MRQHNRENGYPVPWTSLAVLILAGILLLLIVMVYTSGEKKRLINIAVKEIESVAKLKTDQIQRWKRDKFNDARLIYDNLALVEQIEAFFIKSDNKRERQSLDQFLNSLINTYDFGSVVLVDAGGNPGLAVPGTDNHVGSYLRSNITKTISKPEISLTDIHEASTVSFPHLDLIVPMMMRQGKDSLLAGILIFRIDPSMELFPALAAWPTPSTTSECLLLRINKDSLTYLNDPRDQENGVYTMQDYAGDLELEAIKRQIKGERFVRGTDYRGMEVIATVLPVEGTAWYLLAKTDVSEILYRFNREVTLLWIIMSLVLLAMTAIGYLVIKSARARFIRIKYKEELDRQALMKHFDFVLKHGNDIILLLDKDLNIVEANDRAIEAYGFPREKFLGMNASDLRTPQAAAFLPGHLLEINAHGSSYIETIHERSNGTTFPIEISARLVEVDGVQYYQSIGRDITERKKAEEEMSESNKKLNTIINNLRGVVFRCLNDDAWTMKYISDGIYELAGYLPNEFIDNKIRSYKSIIDPEDQSMVRQEIHKALNTGYLYAIEYRIITSSGNKRWVWERGRGYYEGDNLVALEGFISDITDRKRIEEELIRARDKAEQSDRLKTAFLHNISHEIRTPMNAIIGFTTLLDSPDINEETRKQYIDIIYQSSNQLLSIITDIVDISNIETGLVKISRTEVNLNNLIRNLYEQYRLRAHQQNISLLYTTHLSNEESVALTDEIKVIQVMTNLLNNALKFTQKGSIEFGYVIRGDSIEFFVSDTGIGIAKTHHEKVFERFFQVESPNSKQFSGTGLGLSISKAYVELLGGSMWLISTEGKGSLFCFSIPYHKPAPGRVRSRIKGNKS